MRRLGLIVTVLLFAVSASEAADATSYTLENGLRVTLKPIEAGEKVALVIVYDLGEDHDPEARSGLAHLVEHCYVTSAAGKMPVRTVAEMVARYPMAWNAQTGARYTVIGFIFPKEKLEAEIAEAAARMGALRITQADLDREIPRMRVELGNMYDSHSGLAAGNRARMQVLPSPAGSRKGGVIEQIEEISLDVIRAWHEKHYKPVNARLVLLGRFDEEVGRALVEKHFGRIAKGEAPALRELVPPTKVELAEAGRRRGWLARAWRVPAPDSDEYAPFLVLARRLMMRAMPADVTGARPQIRFAPLDDPDVLLVTRRVQADEVSADGLAAVDEHVRGIAEESLSDGEGITTARDFAWLFATIPLPDTRLALEPYGPAFGIARRAQLGLESQELARRLAAVDQAAFDAMLDEVFGTDKGATAVVVDPHPAR